MEATTVTFADLWPAIATVIGSLLALVVAIMRLMHNSLSTMRDRIDESGRESRELIERSSRESRELIESSRQESRELIESSRQESRELLKENRELIEKVHAELSGGLTGVRGELANVRERLAFIEGYLKPPPSTSPPPDDDDAAARAA